LARSHRVCAVGGAVGRREWAPVVGLIPEVGIGGVPVDGIIAAILTVVPYPAAGFDTVGFAGGSRAAETLTVALVELKVVDAPVSLAIALNVNVPVAPVFTTKVPVPPGAFITMLDPCALAPVTL